ncbi:hypothetical protein, partial [Klebsiella aerogenes]|uniref:hypothetical protein n=1 Tax=Klebsiella aerogenes TaxID=548 RepID=UPI00339C688F
MPTKKQPGRPAGTPKTGGRQKGTPNKVTADVKAIAQAYGEEAVKALVKILRDGEAPAAAKVSAAKEIMDRAYGKATQPMEHSGSGGGPIEHNHNVAVDEKALNSILSKL